MRAARLSPGWQSMYFSKTSSKGSLGKNKNK